MIWARLRRDVLSVTGPDAGSYLQGQLSQDVLGLADGGSAWSWLLAPNGKVDALVRVWRRGEGWLVDTDAGWGSAVADRLNRFKLRMKVEITPLPDAVVVAVRGGEAPPSSGPLVSAPGWPGGEGADLLWPAGWDGAPAGLGPEIEDYEAHRVAAGELRMGAELTEKTIPAETGLVRATVSFTKGCYTGQELVARIDARGSNVPRHLRRLRFASPVPAGTVLTGEDGSVAGEITSASGEVGLGYIKRSASGSLRAGDVGVEVVD